MNLQRRQKESMETASGCQPYFLRTLRNFRNPYENPTILSYGSGKIIMLTPKLYRNMTHHYTKKGVPHNLQSIGSRTSVSFHGLNYSCVLRF